MKYRVRGKLSKHGYDVHTRGAYNGIISIIIITLRR